MRSDDGAFPGRSVLAVPGGNERFLLNAAQGPADAVFLDLEDSVLPEEKVAARASVVAALNGIDWRDKTVHVRINDLATDLGRSDLSAVASQCPRLDGILIPKISRPEDVLSAASLLERAGQILRREQKATIGLLLETPLAIVNVEALLTASDRVAWAMFGAGDYSLAMGNYDLLTGLGAVGPAERTGPAPLDPWIFARSRIVNSCRAFGSTAIDGVFMDISDPEGFRAFAQRGRALGFHGALAIHPSQVPIANEVFSPRAEEIAWAKRVLGAMAAPENAGRGAIRIDGAMIDISHLKLARRILARSSRT
jgi:malyl-CoA/(S)-citramalyl-CoA lyase